MPRRIPHPLTRPAVAVLALLGPLAAAACGPGFKDTTPPNGGFADHGWFEAGRRWSGDFPDPHVVRAGGTYYAYASPVAGRYLPVLTSTDLRSWTVHANWSAAGPPGRSGYDVAADPAIPAEIRQSPLGERDRYELNDALVSTAVWGLPDDGAGPWIARDLWAPGVIQIGPSWYVYSAVRTSWVSDDPHGYGRFCLTVASAPGPEGPFRDISGGAPIQCQPPGLDPGGSIDPFPYLDPPSGRYFLLWKAAGKVGGHESALLAVELGGDGLPVPGAPWVKLLETSRSDAWEGDTVENPGMVFVNGATYLFYSANFWDADAEGDSAYAIGYALCDGGPTAPCRRLQDHPLIASDGVVRGPGGSDPFLAADGSLKVAYAAFWRGEERVPRPRRLHVGSVVQNPDRTLVFAGDR
jgi:hypothetical protein